jgi:Ciliary BBSome complex subunit 2, C-terminal
MLHAHSHTPHTLQAILSCDYRMSGTCELLVCGQGGEVRGYAPTPLDAPKAIDSTAAAASKRTSDSAAERTALGKAIDELSSRRAQLLTELRVLEEAAKGRSGISSGSGSSGKPPGSIPADTAVLVGFAANMVSAAAPAVVLRAVVVTLTVAAAVVLQVSSYMLASVADIDDHCSAACSRFVWLVEAVV